MVRVAITTTTTRFPFLILPFTQALRTSWPGKLNKVTIVNQMGNAGNHGPRAEPQVNRFGDFFRTNPPIFRGSKDPLDADF